jgi:PadR family transcriptional regulator
MEVMTPAPKGADLLQGTLDMLVLKVLEHDVLHGFSIAERIHQRSNAVLRVEEGALYPALHRLEVRGWLASHWGFSANNRRAKYYRLTSLGRRALKRESDDWARLSTAVSCVMAPV